MNIVIQYACIVRLQSYTLTAMAADFPHFIFSSVVQELHWFKTPRAHLRSTFVVSAVMLPVTPAPHCRSLACSRLHLYTLNLLVFSNGTYMHVPNGACSQFHHLLKIVL